MKTKVINFVGAPGVGKSVCASLLFAELKIRGHLAEYVQEFAKTLVWKNHIHVLKDQEFIAREQYSLIKMLDGKVKYIVTDSPLFLGLYYNKIYNKNDIPTLQKVQNFILHNMNQFDNTYVFLERADFPYESEGRTQSLKQSIEIENELRKMLTEYGIKFIVTKSDKNNIQHILNLIEQLD